MTRADALELHARSCALTIRRFSPHAHLELSALCVLFTALGAHAQSPEHEAENATAERVRQAFERVAPAGFRGSALVSCDGTVVWEGARGLTAGDSGDPITPEHLFDLGSLSKHVTAAAVLRLVDMRRLALDDPLHEHLAQVPASAERITVRDLLAHTSGLPKALDLSAGAQSVRSQAVLEMLSVEGLGHGSPFAYSNVGYQLAAALVEEVSGEDFEEFVSRELFRTAELRHATLVGGSTPDSRLATLRISGSRSSAIEAFPSGWGRKGTTGVLMSAREFWRWDEALRSGKVLPEQALSAWGEAGPGGYGLGWYVVDDGALGTRLAHYANRVEGYRSSASRWPSRAALVVVLCDESSDPDPIRSALEHALFPDLAAAPEPALPGQHQPSEHPSREHETEVGFQPSALEAGRGEWTLDSRVTWHWPGASTTPSLHAFLPRERPGDGAPVSVYVNVERAAARAWLEELQVSVSRLASNAAAHHRVAVRPDAPVGEEQLWGNARCCLAPFVEQPAESAAFAVLGLRRDGAPPALRVELDRAALERFVAGLRGALGDVNAARSQAGR